ncbi:MAG: GDSL-type esterase/lipase family protein [Gemmiger sp.]
MFVVCYGDSNTYGYDPRSYLGGRYPASERWTDLLAAQTGWKVENRGENGRTIPLRPVTLPQNSDLLIVMLGTNDLLRGADAAAVARRMETFLAAEMQQTMLLVAPPPLQRGAWVAEENLIAESRRLAEFYRQIAQRRKLSFADAGQWGVALSFDGVHFTGQGHQTFAKGLLAVLGQQSSK